MLGAQDPLNAGQLGPIVTCLFVKIEQIRLFIVITRGINKCMIHRIQYGMHFLTKLNGPMVSKIETYRAIPRYFSSW